jgi:dTDP-4-dehydrorhamnose 3,5-epimerase-like enzyme
MNIEQTFIKDLVILAAKIFEDERGYFSKPIISLNATKTESNINLFKTTNLFPNVSNTWFTPAD